MSSTRHATWTLLLSLAGLACASYLAYMHLGMLRGDLLGGAVCGAGVFNCHAVTGGAWGMWLGLPLSFWGLFGYLAVFAFSWQAWHSPGWADIAFTLLVGFLTLFVVIDGILLYAMAVIIRFYCRLCLSTYVINVILLVVSVHALRHSWHPLALLRSWWTALCRVPWALARFWPSGEHRAAAAGVWGMLFISGVNIIGLHLATTFAARGTLGGLQQQIREYIVKQPRDAVESSGDPMLGSPNAPIRVVEFSDFFCPACQRASKMNVILLANHRREMALSFKHYPLDTSCNDKISRMVHPGACTVAAASECVYQQQPERFWAFHDLVFEDGHAYNLAALPQDVQRLGVDMARYQACMDSGQGLEAVKQDIAEGSRRGIGSTPTYIINGVLVTGGLTPSAFDEILAALRQPNNE